MRYWLTLFLFFGSLIGFCQCDRYVDPRTGISIIFVAEDGMFPASWLEPAINQQAKSLDIREIERSKRIILKVFSKYTVHVLQAYLEKVYVVSGLRAYNTPMGGTRSNNRVYVNNEGLKKGYKDDVIERIFHAEFSSVLLLNSDSLFSRETWNSFNDSTFIYRNDDFAAIREGRSDQSLDTLLCKKGFLNQYALTSLENDFNAYAQYLFLPPSRFIATVKKYPRLKSKLFYVIDFYHKIDPGCSLTKLTF